MVWKLLMCLKPFRGGGPRGEGVREERSRMAVDGDDRRPLLKLSEAFIELLNSLKNSTQTSDQEDVVVQLETAPFVHACSFVSPLIGCLGIAFKFAAIEYDAKAVVEQVHDLDEASKSLGTLQMLIDKDVEANCVREHSSHTRNLLRVKRTLDLVRVLFEQIMATEGNSLKNPALTAYAQVFAPYHGLFIRKAVAALMYSVPTKAQWKKMLHEDESSARIQMQNYIAAVAPVTEYIDELFLSRDLLDLVEAYG